MVQELILVRGLPGAGKTTYAKSAFPNHFYCDADSYFLNNGIYNFDLKRIGKAHEFCRNLAKVQLADNKSIVIANTFTTIREIDDYISEIKPNADVIIRVIHVIGNFPNIHDVPDNKITLMRARWQNYDSEEIVHNRYNKSADEKVKVLKSTNMHLELQHKYQQIIDINKKNASIIRKQQAKIDTLIDVLLELNDSQLTKTLIRLIRNT